MKCSGFLPKLGSRREKHSFHVRECFFVLVMKLRPWNSIISCDCNVTKDWGLQIKQREQSIFQQTKSNISKLALLYGDFESLSCDINTLIKAKILKENLKIYKREKNFCHNQRQTSSSSLTRLLIGCSETFPVLELNSNRNKNSPSHKHRRGQSVFDGD